MDNIFWFQQIFNLRQYPVGEPHIAMGLDGFAFFTSELFTNPEPGGRLKIITPLVFNGADGYPKPMRNFDGLALVVMADEILKRHDVEAEFVIPYIPFGRHDRRENDRDGMPLDIVAKILDGVRVTTVDPHSDVSGNMFREITQERFVSILLREFPKLVESIPIIPDDGATKKTYTWINNFDHDPIQGKKIRDPKTGKLSGFNLDLAEFGGARPLLGKDCIIVDDICDGGGTFLGLADKIREAGGNRISLAVPHGFFTKGIQMLLSGIDDIYTLNYNHSTWPLEGRDSLHVIDIKDLI